MTAPQRCRGKVPDAMGNTLGTGWRFWQKELERSFRTDRPSPTYTRPSVVPLSVVRRSKPSCASKLGSFTSISNMNQVRKDSVGWLTVDEEAAGQRIDNFLVR